ncbi:restriction endonuclease subunit S [Vibrio cholerae]|uniref:restriction endonuclease subunit S n=1 Tax=Vibrio cholerae TaxID=666 RepID=UPI000E0B22FB|nr:restriction endonuclease subunit S [Vibrio cholerae]
MSVEKNVPEIRFKGFSGEWVQHNLGKLIDIRSAARVHKEQWTESGVPFFRTSDVVSIYKGQENTKAFISYDVYKELTGKIGKVSSGDLLVTGGGSIGIPFLVPNDEPLYFKDADLLWFKNDQKFDGYFLYTFLFSETFKKYIKSISHIGTIAHYTIEQAKSTPINNCERAEQTAIGNTFHKLDNLINQHQQKHDKLSSIKKAMLEKMFTKQGETIPEIRFKGFSGEWVEVTLGEYAIFTKGQGYSKSDLSESGTPIILYGRLYTKYQTAISQVDTFAIEKSKSVKSIGNEVIVPASGESSEDIARASAVCESGVILGGDLNIIYPNDEINPVFLALVISNGYPQKALASKAQGKSVVHIRNRDLADLLFTMPKKEEQTAIGNYFQKLDALINQHQQQIIKLTNIKQACLSKMFV